METTLPLNMPETLETKPAKPIGMEEIVEQVALDCRVRPGDYLEETRVTCGGE